MAVAMLALGYVQTRFALDATACDVVGGLIVSVGAIAWLELDAWQRGVRMRTWERIGIVLLCVVFVPLRLFRTRGLRGALSSLLALLFLIALGLCSVVGDLLAA